MFASELPANCTVSLTKFQSLMLIQKITAPQEAAKGVPVITVKDAQIENPESPSDQKFWLASEVLAPGVRGEGLT